MINLLPYEAKKQLQASRNNTTLIRYVLTIFFATLFLAALVAGSYYILKSSKDVADNAVVDIQTNSSSYSPTTTKESDFRKDLTIAKSILDRQISYSSILQELARILPEGTILESPLIISIDNSSSLITLKAYSKDSTDNLIKSSFQSSGVFTGYNLQSLTPDATGLTEYPNLVTFSVNITGATQK